jgi:hypothetical protein
MKMKKVVLAWVLPLFGVFAAFIPAGLQAQSLVNLTVDPFQTTVTINAVSCFCFTAVPIPTGKRLVIQDVSLSGAAQTAGTDIQPIIILYLTLGGNNNLRYFAPAADVQVPGQYYADFPTTAYADSLEVAPAYAGYEPTFDTFNVVITGYLIPAPPTPAPSVVKN